MKYLLIVLLLAGCASFEERPIKTGAETRVITLDRTYTATEECNKLGAVVAPGWRVLACAQINGTLCRITMQPAATDDTLGHEARHCFDGMWHK